MTREEIVEALTAVNDAVKGFLAGPDPEAAPVLEVPGLRCLAASPRILLALKVLAHRIGEDEEDVRILARELDLASADEVLSLAEDVFGDRVTPAARFFVEDSSRVERRVGPAEAARHLEAGSEASVVRALRRRWALWDTELPAAQLDCA